MQPKKYVIYTAMVGGYDEIMQPQVVDERFDYILFSNDIKKDRVGVWQVRPIAYTNPDNTRICRYVKTHPEELLSDYDASVWMDSTIRIMKSAVYERIIELEKSGILIASMNHLERHCIYDEAFEVMLIQFEYESVVVKWCHKLKNEQYPKDNGLFETGVMYRKHNNEDILKLDSLWWNCIDNFSKRDQLSFNYVLWKLGLNCEFLLDEYHNVENSECFMHKRHINEGKKCVKYSKHQAWLIKYCRKTNDSEFIKKRYYKIYSKKNPMLWAVIFGQYYRSKEIFRRNMITLKQKIYNA